MEGVARGHKLCPVLYSVMPTVHLEPAASDHRFTADSNFVSPDTDNASPGPFAALYVYFNSVKGNQEVRLAAIIERIGERSGPDGGTARTPKTMGQPKVESS